MWAEILLKVNRKALKINENGARALAQAVIIQAAYDAATGDEQARAWLLDQETADTWGVLAGINWLAVTYWLETGCKIGKRSTRNKARAVIFV